MNNTEDVEFKLRNFIECSRLGTWEWNVQTGETVFNDTWAEIIGYSLDELQPVSIKTWESFTHPDDFKESQQQLEHHFAGNIPFYEIDCKMKHKNGTWVWVHDRGKVVSRTDDGKPLMMFGTHADITERKRTEIALQQEQNRTRAILANQPDGIYIVNEHHHIQYINPVIEREFGKVNGRKCYTYLHDRYEPCPWCKNKEVFAGKSVQWEWYSSKNHKTYALFDMPFHNNDGSISKFEILHDITEQRNTMEQLQANEKLLRNIIDTSTDFIYVKDCNLRTLICNKTFAAAVGKKPADLIGKTDIENGWNHLYVKGDIKKGIRGFEQDDIKALHGEIVHSIDEPGNIGDAVRRFDTIKLPLHNENSEIIGVLGISRDITERMQIEMALRETEERMQFALKSSQIGAWDLDLVDHTAFRTIEHDRIFGYDALLPQWTYEIFLSHVHVEDRAMVDSAFQIAVRNGSNWDFECRINCRVGNQKWIRACGHHSNDANGGHRRMAGIVQDITNRKHAEQQREQGFALLTNLARLVPGVIYQYRLYPDGHSSFPYASSGMMDIYEVTPEEVREDATPVFGRLHPDDLDRVSEEIFRSARTLDTFYCDFRVILPKQGLRWRWSQAHPERTEDGGTLWHGIIIDVTERKLAEQAIAAEKELLSVTLRSIGDGVITTDTKGNISIMNNVAEELTGWKIEEAQGKPLSSVFNIINQNTRKPHDNPVDKVLSTGQIIELANHTLLISREGTERIIADSGAPIKDKEGNTIGVVLVFRDMTEKHKIFDNLQRIDKLDALGVLAGGIAHDFNNLLGGIFGYIDMAKEKCASDQLASGYLDKALTVFERTKDLTLQLLTFSKGGAPKRKTGEIGKLVKKNAAFVLSGSKVICNYNIADDVWLCDYDENQIGQVIDNIVLNAHQAMPNGGTITISVCNIPIKNPGSLMLKAGNYIRVSITDTGTGIPQEHLKRIFDPFYTTKQSGTGLGLSTCYSIVEKHDGYIDVEPVSGKGSTFHVYLPATNKELFHNMCETTQQHKGKGYILVMDDEDYMREIFSDMLSSMGYKPIEAENGEQALKVCTDTLKQGNKICGAIFDLTIPGGMGGKEAIVNFRALFPNIPVFASSGFSEDPVMANPNEYGFTDSIRKPFKKIELAEMLNRHIVAS